MTAMHKLLSIFNKQSGLSLIELLIVIAIGGILASAVSTVISQVFTVNTDSTNRMVAVKQVENAVHWINKDAQMAQVDEDAPPVETNSFPVTLSWENDYDSPAIESEVIYYIANGELIRNYSTSTGESSTKIIAANIQAGISGTNWSYEDGIFYFKITASVGGNPPTIETRSFKVLSRSFKVLTKYLHETKVCSYALW
jgi:prepilin-type N-terminal cleavage/methylation domain-containing protein